MAGNETCPICEEEKKSKEFVTHHISYSPEKTMRVCMPCHRKIHIRKIRDDLMPELTKIQVDVEEEVDREIEMAQIKLKHDQGARISKSRVVQRALHWLVENNKLREATKRAYETNGDIDV